MQGVTLLAGLVLLGSLAVPAGLLASEPAPRPPAPATTAEPVPGEAESQQPSPAGAPAPGTEYSRPADDERRAGDERREADARVAATRTVLMEDIKFKPRRIRIDPGDTVRWENRDQERHDAVGEDGSFETPIIRQGETSSHTFRNRGKFPYFCSIHQGMTGTIQVGTSTAGGGGGDGGSGGASSGGGVSSGGAGSSSGSLDSSGGTGGLGATGSSGGSSSLASTGSELLWLGLIGYGLLALGAFVSLAAIARQD